MKLDGRLNFATIQKLCVLYLILWAMVPPLMLDNIYRYLGLAACAVWFVFAFLRGFKLKRIHLFALLFILLVMIVAYIQTKRINGLMKSIAMYMLVICFIMKEFYDDFPDDFRWIVPIILILYLYFNYVTAKTLIADDTVARLIVRNDPETYHYIRSGVGGYGYIYPQVCIFPALLAWIIKSINKNKLLFVLGLAWLVSYIVLVANANYSIAIFSTVISAIVLLFYRKKSVVGVIIISLVLFISLMMSILYIEPWRKFLLEFFDGTAVAKKINDLVSSSESGEAEGSIASRTVAYENAISGIFSYPIIGGLWNGGGGGHSAILDTMAMYGLFGEYIFIKSFFCTTNYYGKKCNSGFMKRTTNATIVSLLFVSLLDSVPYQFLPVVILFLSIVMKDVERWTADEYENSVDCELNTEELSRVSGN